MFASDGWILASDRMAGEFSQQLDGSAAFISRDVPKIEVEPEGLPLAYCCAGSPAVRDAALEIVNNLKVVSYPAPPTEVQRILVGVSARNRLTGFVPYGSHRIILVYFDNAPQMWTVNFAQGQPVLPEQTNQWVLAGEYNNAGRLLPQLYYARQPCSELIKLAAFTIFYGHQFNPSGVDGLDILVGEDGKEPRLLELKDIAQLNADFNKFHKSLARQFKAKVIDTIVI